MTGVASSVMNALVMRRFGGPAVWAQALKAMARRGRMAVCGSHAGPVVQLDRNWLFRNRLSVVGSSGSSVARFAEARELAGARQLFPTIDSVHPMADAATEFGRLLGRHNRGKVVLRIAEDAVADGQTRID